MESVTEFKTSLQSKLFRRGWTWDAIHNLWNPPPWKPQDRVYTLREALEEEKIEMREEWT